MGLLISHAASHLAAWPTAHARAALRAGLEHLHLLDQSRHRRDTDPQARQLRKEQASDAARQGSECNTGRFTQTNYRFRTRRQEL